MRTENLKSEVQIEQTDLYFNFNQKDVKDMNEWVSFEKGEELLPGFNDNVLIDDLLEGEFLRDSSDQSEEEAYVPNKLNPTSNDNLEPKECYFDQNTMNYTGAQEVYEQQMFPKNESLSPQYDNSDSSDLHDSPYNSPIQNSSSPNSPVQHETSPSFISDSPTNFPNTFQNQNQNLQPTYFHNMTQDYTPNGGEYMAPVPNLTPNVGEEVGKPLFGSFRLPTGNPNAKQEKANMDKNAIAIPQKLQRHNQSEKKRRENMNDYITTLRTLVPSLHTVQKPSKGTILMKTVEYVTRIQQKTNEVSKQLNEANEKLLLQQYYIDNLTKILMDNRIPIPTPNVEMGYRNQNSTGYFAQDAGRTMLLVTALIFFWYAPWSLPTFKESSTLTAENSFDLASGRNLLALPQTLFQMEGWFLFAFWIVIRWFVMTTLLTIAMFSDTMYCSSDLKKKPSIIDELNESSKQCLANGNYQKANRLTREALQILNRPIPTSSFDIFFGIIYQAARQFAHRAIVGLIVDRYLVYRSGQVGYATQLKETYLNYCQQVYSLPGYNKWTHLYVLLCCVNLAELTEGEDGDGLVQAYASLAYHVVVHTKLFEIFATIYMYLAFSVANRKGLERSQFGSFYIIVAYRHLLYGHFDEVFENLQKGIDTHKAFGLSHHFRECLMMKGWIQHVLGQRESLETFRTVFNSAKIDDDGDSKCWGILGLMANYIYNGDQEKALEWLQSYNALIEEIKAPNEHQHAFLLGFKSSLYLREGMEDKALEIADQGLDYLKNTVNSGMPHNTLPLQKILDVHLTMLEKYQRGNDKNSQAMVEKLISSCQEGIELLRQSTTLFPLMRSLYYLYQGRFVSLVHGNIPTAINYFKRCAASSQKFKLRHIYALALFEWGRLCPVGSVERMDKLEEALNIFCDIDALYEEQLTRAELKKIKEDQFIDRLFIVKYLDLE